MAMEQALQVTPKFPAKVSKAVPLGEDCSSVLALLGL